MEEERKNNPRRRVVAIKGGYAVFGAAPHDGGRLMFGGKKEAEEVAELMGGIVEKE